MPFSWARSYFRAFHEKAFVIDGRTAAVMSLNLTRRYYSDTRDPVVLDRQRSDARAIETVFSADRTDSAMVPPVRAGVVWSPRATAVLAGPSDQPTPVSWRDRGAADVALIDALVGATESWARSTSPALVARLSEVMRADLAGAQSFS